MRSLEDVHWIGVAGAGTTGSAVAQVAATNGYDVVLRDIDQRELTDGVDSVQEGLDRYVRKDRLSESEAATIGDRITATTEIDNLVGCDLIVEAVDDDLDVKRDLFGRLDERIPDDIVLATTTSTLSVTAIASATNRAGLVVGIHFMDPIPVVPGVEVVTGEKTEARTVKLAHEYAGSLEKQTWQSDDRPGFVVNRVLVQWINEGIRVFDEGVATKEDVDRGLKLGTNVPMGPLELADHIGLDVCLTISETLQEEFGERCRPPYLLKRKVEAGDLGKKTGQGFYEYE
jgi:3-hydroxybutyryl-CoA dehydrogenase